MGTVWADARAATEAAGLLGLGSWVQGFRCFPWMGVNFYLKDGLGVSPSALQLLQSTANLPMVGKPVYGIVSDAIYIRGGHRLPYIAIGAILQAISWLVIAFLPESHVTISNLTMLLLLGNLGASICEVANDAIVAEVGRQAQPSGRLQSFVWMFGSFGGVVGNLLCGVTVQRFGPRSIFFIFALILIVQFVATISVSEKSLNLPASLPEPPMIRRRGSRGQFMLSTDFTNQSGNSDQETTASSMPSIKDQLYRLSDALHTPDIVCSLCWFAASYAVVPVLMSTMFYYQTQFLKLDSSVIGLSKVVGQVAVLSWSVVYNNRLKNVSPRKLMSTLQVMIALFMATDVFFVKGIHQLIGLSDTTYVILFSGLLEVLLVCKLLPFSVLMAQLCPPGCEGSLMAFAMSATSLSMIISGYLGVALATNLGISGEDFSGLTRGILVQATCALLPLCFTSLISDGKLKKKKE